MAPTASSSSPLSSPSHAWAASNSIMPCLPSQPWSGAGNPRIGRIGAACGSRDFQKSIVGLQSFSKLSHPHVGMKETSWIDQDKWTPLRESHSRPQPAVLETVSRSPRAVSSSKPRKVPGQLPAQDCAPSDCVVQPWWQRLPEAPSAIPSPSTPHGADGLEPGCASPSQHFAQFINPATLPFHVSKSSKARPFRFLPHLAVGGESDDGSNEVAGNNTSASEPKTSVEELDDESHIKSKAIKLADKYCGQLERLEDYRRKWRHRRKRLMQSEKDESAQMAADPNWNSGRRLTGSFKNMAGVRASRVRFRGTIQSIPNRKTFVRKNIQAQIVDHDNSASDSEGDAKDIDQEESERETSKSDPPFISVQSQNEEEERKSENVNADGVSSSPGSPRTIKFDVADEERTPSAQTPPANAAQFLRRSSKFMKTQQLPKDGLSPKDNSTMKPARSGSNKLADSDRDPNLPTEMDAIRIAQKYRFQLAEAREQLHDFRTFDKECRGFLTHAQFAEVIRVHLCLGPDIVIPESAIANIFSKTDTDNDNQINFEEFFVWTQTAAFSQVVVLANPHETYMRSISNAFKVPLPDVEWIWKEFHKYADTDNVVDKEHFQSLLKSLFRTKCDIEIPQKRLDNYWADADPNRYGIIAFPDFLSWYNRYFGAKCKTKSLSEVCPVTNFYSKLGTDRLHEFYTSLLNCKKTEAEDAAKVEEQEQPITRQTSGSRHSEAGMSRQISLVDVLEKQLLLGEDFDANEDGENENDDDSGLDLTSVRTEKMEDITRFERLGSGMV